MKAWVLNRVSDMSVSKRPLELMEIPAPAPKSDQVLIQVSTCGVCHTELDEIEGRMPPPGLPIIPGHQVVGQVVDKGKKTKKFSVGDRVGVGWIFSACGKCRFCNEGNENLCPEFMATGRDANGGYAQYMAAPEKFAHRIPDVFSDAEAAPLLCAGAIGYRALRLSNIKNGQKLGLTGFGASAHLVLKMAQHLYPDTSLYVFARSEIEREFAKTLGAIWTGHTTDKSPGRLDAIIDTTPAWMPVVEALANLESGGRLVINAIRKESTDKKHWTRIEYHDHLWMEKEIKSVANVSSSDIFEFIYLAADMGISPEIQEYAFDEACQALEDLKSGHIKGAKVLRVDQA
ncbi:MAG: zinc-dependent alcohol dehydrogenase family protein [Desulfobacterales bacterium]|jgi:propanol-preferring alcohol dehydrogenase|nr:zinc-dependent alcohol dehydrogenase family protein [Desulfobacterales bacterium]